MVNIEVSVYLKSKTVYKMSRGASFTSWEFFMHIKKYCSAKHGQFESLLSVSSSVISTTAMSLAFSIIPEFMQYVEPDFFQYLFHCKCCIDFAYCQKAEIARVSVDIVCGVVGDGRLCQTSPGSSQRKQWCKLSVRLIMAPIELKEDEFPF